MHLWWGEDRNRRDESGQPSEGSIHRERLSGEPRFPCSLVLGAVEMLPRVGELRGLRLRPAGPALQRVEPEFYTQFLCLFMTGLRLGESLGLEWDDLEERSMCVARTVDSQTGNVGTPKGGKSRNVDMNVELIEALRRWKVRQAEKALKEGRGGELPARVFPM